jgi:hypothetical protein
MVQPMEVRAACGMPRGLTLLLLPDDAASAAAAVAVSGVAGICDERS